MLAEKITKQLDVILNIAAKGNKKSGFVIGNTAKNVGFTSYTTPIRNMHLMVIGGAIVYSEEEAIEIAKIVDGRVEYVLVDAEKKIADKDSKTGEPGNIEREVREAIKQSKLWTFKGNDLSVEAADTLLSKLLDHSIRGVGGKRIAIIGCGNLGSKLALKLVERGANVFVTRRNKRKLETIVAALNTIKPIYTIATVQAYENNIDACKDADIVVGATQGEPVICESIVDSLKEGAIIIDIGKGSIKKEAIALAHKSKHSVYRLDVSCAFAGVVAKLMMMEQIFTNQMGRRKYRDQYIVSGGIMGERGDIVVDDINNPKQIYGIADGSGDFMSKQELKEIDSIDLLNTEKL
ncbi:MAG: NAD(P)-binding domain-containing protein [Gammaproteobacteria bacterium]|nr:NAD(P)-binding domain-containing protein [Gammaproteobacteria bacterium]MCH9743468.1 NAD(P)-binding domain-containing protein [Gammaproteobacteria bacterium]